MTIASALDALNTDIQNARTAITNKGGTVTANGGSSQLATDIATIPSGSGSTPVIESLSVTPTTSSQTITASGGVDGYSPITVSAVDNTIDSNITAGNIKSGVNILGITGTYEGSGGGGNVGYIPREVSQQGVYQYPSNNFTFSLPSNATSIGPYTFMSVFYGCTSITSADLSSLITISGQATATSCFGECTSLTTVDLSSLTTISGNYTMNQAFYSCTRLSNISFPSLTTISGDYTMQDCFRGCTGLTSITFPELTTITGNRPLLDLFFGCTNLTSISFPALTPNSSISHNVFSDMLLGCSNVTVHFPFDMESTMSSWSDVRNGFGGTNTTVLFDLGGCELTFAITPNSGNRLIVNGEELTGTTVGLAKNSTANYEIYNSSYGLYASTYSVPNTDSATVTVDITTPTYNTISLDTSVSGLTVTATIDGVTYTLPENGNTGVYTLNIYNNTGSNISVSYFVSGGSSYADATGTLTFSSTDITETITMQQAQVISFTRPDLTANGTMGGDAFAVKSGTSTTAYRAVDSSSTSSVTISSANNYEFIFYNPDALKVSELGLDFSTTSYAPTNITIEGSNDNENWTSVNTWSGSASTYVIFTVNSSVYYKYHKLTFTPNGTTVRLEDLDIAAVYKG